jgi:hypothetical protein
MKTRYPRTSEIQNMDKSRLSHRAKTQRPSTQYPTIYHLSISNTEKKNPPPCEYLHFGTHKEEEHHTWDMIATTPPQLFLFLESDEMFRRYKDWMSGRVPVIGSDVGSLIVGGSGLR